MFKDSDFWICIANDQIRNTIKFGTDLIRSNLVYSEIVFIARPLWQVNSVAGQCQVSAKKLETDLFWNSRTAMAARSSEFDRVHHIITPYYII